MNEVFLIGKVITDIEFKFTLNFDNISIVTFQIRTISDNQVLKIKAYDELADYIYRSIEKDDVVMIEGYLTKNHVEVKEIFSFSTVYAE